MISINFRYYLLIFSSVCFLTLHTRAQKIEVEEDEPNEVYARIHPLRSMTLEVGLPIALKNNIFKQYMQGMIEISPTYHYTFKNFLTIGGGINYNYFWINHVLTSDSKNLGGIQSIGGFVRIGYEKFYTDRYGIDVNVKIGPSKLIFDTDYNRKLDKLPSLNVLTIEPSVAFVVTADEQSSYRWIVSYANQKYDFKSSLLGFAPGKLNTNPTSSITQFLTVGFGYTYYIKQR